MFAAFERRLAVAEERIPQARIGTERRRQTELQLTRSSQKRRERRVIKKRIGYWPSMLGAIGLALLLNAPAQADRVEDMMTVTEAGQDGKVQGACPARRAKFTGCKTRSMTVAYGDLDLASQLGAHSLYRRLHRAARTVCGANDGHYTPYVEQRRAQAQCGRATLDRAVTETGIERVVAVHREATGRDVTTAAQLAGSP